MIDDRTSDRTRFYRERDSRTASYLGNDVSGQKPVMIHVSADACETRSGQLLLLTLVNQLARMHRELRFAVSTPDAPMLTTALFGGSSLGDELCRLARWIDPFGRFVLDASSLSSDHVSVGLGAYCRRGLTWYLGFDRWNAKLDTKPCQAGSNVSADLVGAGLASTLGAAAVTKAILAFEIEPVVLSAWNFQAGADADPGPHELQPIDVGQGLMVGAGAVAAAAVYWLMQWGNMSPWTIIDRDKVELHNTNRGLLFFPSDAGWPDQISTSKAPCLSKYLSNATPVEAWYDEAREAKQQFDTVLVLANERDVRTSVSWRNDPVQLQATTGQSWLSQFHRHIAGHDDCVRCRMADVRPPQMACSAAPTATAEQPTRPDASLPFLSAASGLMLVSALQRLQRGALAAGERNMWGWDFRNTRRMVSSGTNACRDDCLTALGTEGRRSIASKTRWASEPWAG